MAKKSIQSVEPNIADLANGWLRSYNLDYKLEQESLNFEIDKALDDYFSKNGAQEETVQMLSCFYKTISSHGGLSLLSIKGIRINS